MNDCHAKPINLAFTPKTLFSQHWIRFPAGTGPSELRDNLARIHDEMGRLVQETPITVDDRNECDSSGAGR